MPALHFLPAPPTAASGLAIELGRVNVTIDVTAGQTYQLEFSNDRLTWSPELLVELIGPCAFISAHSLPLSPPERPPR